ncbi:unnamed protein product [Scytosiphon promiscuus]
MPPDLFNASLINVGEPGAVNKFNVPNVRFMEKKVIDLVTEFWGGNPADHTGYVASGGSESNTIAVVNARDVMPDPHFLVNSEAHYSVLKACRVAGIPSDHVHKLDVDEGFNARLGSFAELLIELNSRKIESVAVFIASGTTFLEGQDNIAGMLKMLNLFGFPTSKRYVHIDAASSGFFLPAYKGANPDRVPGFQHDIDSMSASVHKYPGSPFVGSVFVAKQETLRALGMTVEYVGSLDFTLSCSRGTKPIMWIYQYLMYYKAVGTLPRIVGECGGRAEGLGKDLVAAGVPGVVRNQDAVTVAMPQPSAEICDRFMLTSQKGRSQVVVLPHVTDGMIEIFFSAYTEWWNADARGITE